MIISNVTKDSAELEWKPPLSDGGCELQEYIVEYRTATRTTWSTAGKVPPKTTTFKATDLIESLEYFFRVVAVNAEGRSLPLVSTDVVKPMRELGKYPFIILIYFSSHYYIIPHIKITFKRTIIQFIRIS